MFLSEVHDQLCSAELSMLFDGEGDVLNAKTLPKTNAIIQAGINDLNKKFAIRENELLLRTKEDKLLYELIPANAVSSGNLDAFIIDSVSDPYVGDLMQIWKVSDSNGNSLWLNTDVAYIEPVENIYGTRPSIFSHKGINTPAYNTLKLHEGHKLGDLLVHYKAKLKPMDLSTTPDMTHIDLPDHYLNALVLYVASRKYNPKGAETIGRGMFHEGNNYWSKYKEECDDIRANMGSIASTGESTNFQRNGWV